MSAIKSKLAVLLSIIIIGGAAFFGWIYLERSEANILSQDATLTADITNISIDVPGRIDNIAVAENQAVKKGQLLFSIDAEPYRLLLVQAEADLKAAEALYNTQKRTIAAEQANVKIAVEQIERARVNLDLTTQSLQRLLPLQAKGFVTDQVVQDARTLKLDSEVSLRQALEQNKAADALVNSLDAAEAVVENRKVAVELAKRNLEHTKVYSPHNGRVVGLNTSTGEFIITGQSIFSLVNTDRWYTTALYREGELTRIKVGSCAVVYVMADQSISIKGRVQGIGWGVSSEDAINIPRNLPYIPKALDWVRVAQRFPVRIELSDAPEHLMRAGASATAVVKYDDDC